MPTLELEQSFYEKAISAVADPIRIRILQEILQKGYVRCCDVVEITGLSQPTCSHHIKLLVEGSLVVSQKDGRYNNFTINKENFSKLAEFINYFTQS